MVRFRQVSLGLYRVLFYSGFGLDRFHLVYTGFDLDRFHLVYTGFGLDRFHLVYTGFCFIHGLV